MSECLHTARQKVIERLGLMTEKPDGTVSAPVLAWSERCLGCYETVASHEVAYGAGESVPLATPAAVVVT